MEAPTTFYHFHCLAKNTWFGKILIVKKVFNILKFSLMTQNEKDGPIICQKINVIRQ